MMRLYSTLTRQKEEFVPSTRGEVRMYTCGPTVYRYAHIGNLRTYLMADWLRRTLMHLGFNVRHVKNITDVGHMRQEMLEQGEDKIIAAALAEGKTPQEIAAFYTEAFWRDEAKLNILPATVFPKATEHVPEMIALNQALAEKGYAYEVDGNLYFSVGRFPGYGRLSGNLGDDLLEGVRAEADPNKRDPRDFTLWKAAEPGRMMKWDSPWGEGFPGWHIECSAMSIKHLGPHIDIHTGGVDNIFPHHEGEIAQSEAVYGGPFVRYWVHGQHLLVNGVKMAKSAGNAYTVDDLERLGFEPLAFRYLCLTVHYRRRMNFTFPALRAAQRALDRLREIARWWHHSATGSSPPREAESMWRQRFWDAVEDDLGLPEALAIVWQMVHTDELEPDAKLRLLAEFDAVLGLDIMKSARAPLAAPTDVTRLVEERERFRQLGRYAEADALRRQVGLAGYTIGDTSQGPWLRRLRPADKLVGCVASSKEVESLLNRPAMLDISVSVVAHNNLPEVRRLLESILAFAGDHTLEIVVVDNGSVDETAGWLENLSRLDSRLRFIRTDHNLGEAEARNITFKRSGGRHIVVLDASVELDGNLFDPVMDTLRDNSIGLIGRWGVHSEDLHDFHEVEEGEVDAIQGYCYAFRRDLLREVGLLDEKYRFYRHLDLDFSFSIREKGYRILAQSNLPLIRHAHTVWENLSPDEREKWSKRNFYRFLSRWGHRHDLLVASRGG